MKIAITTVQAPFITGGAEFLANNLRRALIKNKFEAEIITMPFMDRPLHLIEDHIVASRLIHLEDCWAGHIDLCIGLKFPAYCIPHSNKVIWALHQHRAAYDLFNTQYSNIKDDDEGNRVKSLIYKADRCYLKEAKRIYTIADNVTNRMKKYNNVQSRTLYHPCPDMDKFYSGEYENYILMPSRINITKRQHLAIEAMAQSKSDIKLYIMGKADNTYECDKMLDLIKKYKLQNRIRYFDYVSQEEKFKLYANAKAVLFIPFDEDYGYITLEAMSASKAVITATDSGGPLEFVADGHNGFVVLPDPIEIAKVIDELAKTSLMAESMGRKAKEHISNMNISWDSVVKELTKL